MVGIFTLKIAEILVGISALKIADFWLKVAGFGLFGFGWHSCLKNSRFFGFEGSQIWLFWLGFSPKKRRFLVYFGLTGIFCL